MEEAPTREAATRTPARFKDFYQFASPTRLVVGRGMIEGAGFEFMKEGAERVLLVTDRVIRGTGLVERVEAGVVDGGLEVAAVFDDVPQDSDTQVVGRCAEAAAEAGADAILAVGGGSVIDTAKAANVIWAHGGGIRDWEGFYGLPREADGLGRPRELAPLAAIPTTAGTGSEVSFAVVVKDREEQLKYTVADFPMFPRLAILDPESTRTLPAPIAAATGMDALTHAIEGYVSSESNSHADAHALHALRLIRDNLPRAVQDPGDEDARGNMLVAAALAIVPTGSGAIGITHSMSHPCGGQFGVPHGVANAINLPHVIRFNAAEGPEVADRYRDVAELLGAGGAGPDDEMADALAQHVSALTRSLGLPQRLSEVGVPEAGIPSLVEAAMGDGCTLVNPREPSEEDFAELYRRAL